MEGYFSADFSVISFLLFVACEELSSLGFYLSGKQQVFSVSLILWDKYICCFTYSYSLVVHLFVLRLGCADLHLFFLPDFIPLAYVKKSQ